MTSSQEWLTELRGRLTELSPDDLRTRLSGSTSSTEASPAPIVLDVRERDEFEEGAIPGAAHVPRGFLELRIEKHAADRSSSIVLYCAGGSRSLFAAEALERMGYTDVSSLAGGFNGWKQAGGEVHRPTVLRGEDRQRYARHLVIPEVGEEGQQRLLASRVLLVGAGGLGSPAAFYLAAAGVGTLGIIDPDVVDASNLQRQILHTENRLGLPKVDSAAQTLRAINSGVRVNAIRQRLDRDNVDELFEQYDVILDGTDNFATRYLVNDACVRHRKPNVHGSVYRFEGQVSVFWAGRGPCYRCLYPEPPPPELAPSCAEAGVLGILPGVVGLLEAVETIKILLGKGDLLVGRLMVYDALAARFQELKIRRNPDCSYCADGVEFPGYVDYEDFCSGAGSSREG